jgi:hypothetical protein
VRREGFGLCETAPRPLAATANAGWARAGSLLTSRRPPAEAAEQLLNDAWICRPHRQAAHAALPKSKLC